MANILLQSEGYAPTTEITPSGWQPGSIPPEWYSLLSAGRIQQYYNFSPIQPNGIPNGFDSLISEKVSGNYIAPGNGSIDLTFINTGTETANGSPICKVWKTADFSTFTSLSDYLTINNVNLPSNTNVVCSIAWPIQTPIAMNNEYLLFQIIWKNNFASAEQIPNALIKLVTGSTSKITTLNDPTIPVQALDLGENRVLVLQFGQFLST